MSGFAAVYLPANRTDLSTMMAKIRHRGPHFSGRFETDTIAMAQNYLRADIPATRQELDSMMHAIPVAHPNSGKLRICYDGQIGNNAELIEFTGVEDKTFTEEKLVLTLYEQENVGLFEHLKDAVFAFVISDGSRLLAARDLLGIKTLFYGKKNGTVYFASELKSLLSVTEDVNEFPPGHYMDADGNLTAFDALPKMPPDPQHPDPKIAADKIYEIIRRSIRGRIDFRIPTGSLLSGGIDSSVIAFLATQYLKEACGDGARLKTYALGVGESQDIVNARLMAEFLESDHKELMVDLDRILEVLPEVIYYLESFDPSLVRSAASNFLVSRYAKNDGLDVLLSGEGGDEVFCGYAYLKKFPPEEQFRRQMACLGFLHNNASLRLDRMNHCHSIRVVAPLISGELLGYAMDLPPEYKQKPRENEIVEKWIFRKAFEDKIPDRIVWRLKQEFSQGSGSADVLPNYFDQCIGDEELSEAQAEFPMVRSKEELHYFRLFTEHFGEGKAIGTVGQWISL